MRQQDKRYNNLFWKVLLNDNILNLEQLKGGLIEHENVATGINTNGSKIIVA